MTVDIVIRRLARLSGHALDPRRILRVKRKMAKSGRPGSRVGRVKRSADAPNAITAQSIEFTGPIEATGARCFPDGASAQA
jgi:hypothetical protein